MSQSSSPFGRLPAVSCRLQEVCADEAVEVAVQHGLGVPDLEIRPVVLHELVRVEDVAAHSVPAEAHVDAAPLPGKLGLAHKMDSLPDELSGGEQQRVSIARAVVNHPPLLVCDEPTGNLDPDTSVGIMQLLYRINRAGTTILMVTHDREMVDKMRKRVIALEEGRLARDERRGGYTSE